MFLLNPFIFTTSAPSCSGDLISTSNLVGYWSLNGASNDLSGNNYLLTNYNSLVVYTSGIAKFSQSGVFLTGSTDPGSARRALYRSSSTGFPNTNSTSAAATYMGWFNFDNLPTTGECYLFSNAKSGQRAVTITYQSTNNIRIQIYDGGSAYQTDYSHTPTTDTWYHYAITQNAGVFTIFINGASAHTWTNTNNGVGGGDIIRIGGHEGTNVSFLGHIDDVAIYSRVLSTAEIQTVYNSTCPLRSPKSGDLLINANLLSYYNFNGSVIDYSGNDFVAASTGLTYTSSGKFSSGGTFDGSTSIVQTTTALPAMTEGSVAFWFSANSVSNSQIIDDDLDNKGINVQIFSNKLYFGVKDGTGGWANTAGNITTGRWYHAVGTWNGVNIKLYIDSYLTATTVNANTVASSKLRLGQTTAATSKYNGNLDELSIWSRELTQSEITDLYNATIPLRSTIMTANTVGYYAMEANENDSTPNARTLTNTSVTWATGKGGTYSAAFITGSTLVDSATKKLTTSTQIVETVSTSTSGLSVSGWFSLANLPSQVGYTSIAWILAGTSQRAIWLEYTQAGAWRLVFFDGATQYVNAWTTTPTLNQWYHICFVMQPSTGVFNVYFDGVSRISGTNTNNGNSGFSNRLTIGSYDSVARTWLGYIDEFAIWSRPLAYNEVQNLYNSGAGDYYPFTS